MIKLFSKLFKCLRIFKKEQSLFERILEDISKFSDGKIEQELLPLLPNLKPAEFEKVIKLLNDSGFVDNQIAFLMTEKKNRKLQIIETLMLINNEKSLKAMVEAMKDPNEEVKWALTEGIKKSKDPSIIPNLIESLNYPNQWLPARVAEICLAFGESSMPYLLQALRKETGDLKALIIEIIGELAAKGIKNEDIRDHTILALKDNHPKIKMAAIQTLAQYKEKEDGNHLVEFLYCNNWFLRVKAGQALKNLGWSILMEDQRILLNKDTSVEKLKEVASQVKTYNLAG